MEEKLTITAIEPQKRKKNRYNIYADGEYIASLGDEAIVRASIKVGAAISQSAIDEAVLADNTQYAFDSAAALLAHGMRTRGDLEQRLRDRGIADAAIETAMNRLAAYGYVDDKAYAKEFVRCDMASGRWGRIVVAQRLREKKLSREIIDESLKAYTDEDEKKNARCQLQAFVSKNKDTDKRLVRQKAFAALTRHGFSYDIISELFSEAND